MVATQEQIKAFIMKYLPFAKDIESRWGVPVSLSLAQAANETGWGLSIPEGTNNFFGIKASDGFPHQTYTTWEEDSNGSHKVVKAGFNIYKDPSEAFDHYAKILHKDHFIKKGWKGLDSIAAIFAIQSGDSYKYATDSKYADKITNIINAYDLKQYDSGEPLPAHTTGIFAQSPNVTPKPDDVKEFEKMKDVPLIGGLLGWLWKKQKEDENLQEYWKEHGGLGETIKDNFSDAVEEITDKGKELILAPILIVVIILALLAVVVFGLMSLTKGGVTE